MSRFVDRDSEMETLEREYRREEASFVVIYGRRRVGKTALINEFCKNKPALYYLATEESESQNRMAFHDMVADYLGTPSSPRPRSNDGMICSPFSPRQPHRKSGSSSSSTNFSTSARPTKRSPPFSSVFGIRCSAGATSW